MLLKNGTFYSNGKFESSDLRIINQTKWVAGKNLPTLLDETVIDVKNKYIVPGLIDVHVHLREPGFEYKETIKTGAKSGAAGGFTCICAMPNVKPAPDSVESIQRINEIIERDACISVYQYACITKEQEGKELTNMSELRPYSIGFSDDGYPVMSDDLMESAMKNAALGDYLIAAHCEDLSCEDPRMSEYLNIKRDLEYLKHTGGRYHVCHVSSKISVDLIRQAKKQGLNVTCETAPHYLVFTEDDVKNGSFVMNPPLGSYDDKQALIEGIIDGTVDIIATDHAPHTVLDKQQGAKGVIGMETAFSVMYTNLVKTNLITLEKLIELMSINPAKIFKIPRYSDFTVLDLHESYKIDSNCFQSKGRNTPFEDMAVYGRVVMTICKGRVVWEYTR